MVRRARLAVRISLLVLLVACGGGGKPAPQSAPPPPAAAAAPPPAPASRDEKCARFVERSKPLLEELTRKEGKTIQPAAFDKLGQDCRDGKTGEDEKLVDCVAGAADDPTVRECWKAAFESYRDATKANRDKTHP